jgi:hypothetical protein
MNPEFFIEAVKHRDIKLGGSAWRRPTIFPADVRLLQSR